VRGLKVEGGAIAFVANDEKMDGSGLGAVLNEIMSFYIINFHNFLYNIKREIHIDEIDIYLYLQRGY